MTGRLIVLATTLLSLSAPLASQQPTPRVSVPSGRTAAQDAAAARLGRSVTNEEIANALRSSGLTQAEIRARLIQAGMDPSLADPYFAAGGLAGSVATAPADSGFVSALEGMGILASSTGGFAAPTSASARAPTGAIDEALSGPINERVFGRGVFARRSSLFDPVASGPVDASYRVGVGDQLQVVLTGDVEAAYLVEIRRDGTITLPQIGRVTVAGLTLDGARTLLGARASRVYSGIASGKTTLDLTVGQVRSNQVFVLGEIESPGAYQVSALSTVFHAVARAGGPTERGSFRSVEVRRGGKLLRTVDIYPFLLSGDGGDDLRLEQGDVVFVPLAKRVVEVRGAVRRAGIFELLPNEGMRDLLGFTGGLRSTAATDRLAIDRILPPAERTPGHDRAVVDIAVNGDPSALDTVTVFDGDIVHAFDVVDLRRNTIAVLGEVFQPGTFEWRPGMRLTEAIALAQGAKPWGLTDRVMVNRPILRSGRSESFSVNVDAPEGASFEVHEFDSLTVLDGRIRFPAGPVRVLGAVNRPGTHRYVERQTLRDLLDVAGGLTEEATTVELARRRVGTEYSDTSAVVLLFTVNPRTLDVPGADTLVLERHDIITVRESPGFRTPQTVVLTGHFTHPGTFTILSDGERLSSVVRRAGGLLPTAFPESFRLVRDGRPVAIDFARALRRDARDDVILEAGDQLSVGPNPTVVLVSGAVQRQVSVPFTKGWGMRDYIDAAGGTTQGADRSKRYVEYASGAIRRPRRLLFVGIDPTIRPGATIHVPQAPPQEEGRRFSEVFASTFQVVATLASIAIAYVAATK